MKFVLGELLLGAYGCLAVLKRNAIIRYDGKSGISKLASEASHMLFDPSIRVYSAFSSKSARKRPC
jgi:hypothetical protein